MEKRIRKIKEVKNRYIGDAEIAELFVDIVELGGYEFLESLSNAPKEVLKEVDMVINNYQEVAVFNLRRFAEQVEGDNQVYAFVVADGDIQAYKTDSMEELGMAIVKESIKQTECE